MKLYKANYLAGTVEEVEGHFEGKGVRIGERRFQSDSIASYHETKEQAIKALVEKSGGRVAVVWHNYIGAKDELGIEEARHKRVLDYIKKLNNETSKM